MERKERYASTRHALLLLHDMLRQQPAYGMKATSLNVTFYADVANIDAIAMFIDADSC